MFQFVVECVNVCYNPGSSVPPHAAGCCWAKAIANVVEQPAAWALRPTVSVKLNAQGHEWSVKKEWLSLFVCQDRWEHWSEEMQRYVGQNVSHRYTSEPTSCWFTLAGGPGGVKMRFEGVTHPQPWVWTQSLSSPTSGTLGWADWRSPHSPPGSSVAVPRPRQTASAPTHNTHK